MEWKSCELGEIFLEGSQTCLLEHKLCLRCMGGIREPVDSEASPGSDQDLTGTG
jgi:hypothetical protein